MIPHSPGFARASTGPHRELFEVDVLLGGRVALTVPVSDLSVSVDMTRQIRRQLSCTLADPGGRWIPKGAGDIFNPTVGAVLRPRGGVEIPGSEELVRVHNSQASWRTGTYDGVVDSGDGGITLA